MKVEIDKISKDAENNIESEIKFERLKREELLDL